jgi:hypothetical protein
VQGGVGAGSQWFLNRLGGQKKVALQKMNPLKDGIQGSGKVETRLLQFNELLEGIHPLLGCCGRQGGAAKGAFGLVEVHLLLFGGFEVNRCLFLSIRLQLMNRHD